MSTEAALLAAIRANPDEDTPRLVYADWLDEHADALPDRDPKAVRARAEFIRLQISSEGRDQDPDFDDARERSGTLRGRYGPAWVKWDPVDDREGYVPYWLARRGFIERRSNALTELLDTTDEDLARVPITHLRGLLTNDLAQRLAVCPHLRHVRKLELNGTNDLTRDDADALFRSPHILGVRELKVSWLNGYSELITQATADSERLAGLEAFEFWQDQFTMGAALAIANSKTLRLRRLNGWGEFSDAGVTALANSPAVSRLEWLRLGYRFGTAAALALAQSPYLGPLWYLGLGGNEIGPDGVTAIARCPRLAALRAIDLGSTRPGPKGLAELARSEHIRGLRGLDLRYNALRKAGEIAAEGPAFARLLSLELYHNNIGDSGVAALGRSSVLKELKRLNVSNCGITAAGAKALADGDALETLTHLDLGHNRVGADGVEAIGRANRFPHLRMLILRNNLIGDAGAIALANSPQMVTIESLYLRSNKIGDAGAKALLDSPHFPNLKMLDLSHNKISRSLKTAIEKRFKEPTE